MESHSLYGGEVILNYDDDSHTYFVDGNPVPGVTGVMEIVNKPALVGWASKMGAEWLKKNMTPGKSYDEIEIDRLCDGIKKAPRAHTTTAASIGTLVHKYCEGAIKFRLGIGPKPDLPVNEMARNAISQFADWVKKHDVKFIASEAKIYSRLHEFAGTLDIDAEVNGKRCIVDLKTSNGIWPEMRCQTAAYQQARQEELGVEYHSRWILRVPKDGTVFEAKEYLDFPTDLRGFLGALELTKVMRQIKDSMKEKN